MPVLNLTRICQVRMGAANLNWITGTYLLQLFLPATNIMRLTPMLVQFSEFERI